MIELVRGRLAVVVVVVVATAVRCLSPETRYDGAARRSGARCERTPLALTAEELTALVGGRGRASSIWESIRRGVEPVSEESGLTRKTREALAAAGIDKFVPASVESAETARDGTTKLLVRLDDGLAVETVIIPHLHLPRTTVCVSTQVGCDRGCAFCATARMGLVRDLAADEIAAQFYHATRHAGTTMTNVVFMGMGDAGRNADQAASAAAILTDDAKFRLARSKVTVSTVGPSPDCFDVLARAPCMLAWSLHSADDDLRRRLVPTHASHSVLELRDALARALADRPAVRTRTLMLAATLIADLNDSDDDARRLADFVGPLVDVARKVNVDLIPVNPVAHAPHFAPPTEARLARFAALIRHLEPRVHVALRVQRGDDKAAACGQLLLHHTKAQRARAAAAKATSS